MALINPTSFAGVILLLYLSSFILLAILRIATGVSIQRVGYFSLRHIAFTPREGLKIELRGLGLSLHRPTFAQPTWISLVLTELKVIVDPVALDSSSSKENSTVVSSDSNIDLQEKNQAHQHSRRKGRSQLWKKLTDVKERLKRIHRKIKWIRMLDLIAVDTMIDVVGVGYVQISQFTTAVHTRRKLLDRGRLFRHKKDPLGDQRPAEWIFTMKSVLLGVGGREPVEMLDGMSMNVHGLLYKDREGLRDTSIAVKAGRLYIPVDDLLEFSGRNKKVKRRSKEATFTSSTSLTSPTSPMSPVEEISFEDVVDELDSPGSREASIVQTVADSKEFFSSVLRSVQEVQVGLSFIRLSKELEGLRQANLPLICNVVTHEIGIDLHRLDQHAPAHRMYFAREDVAHQALVAAVSISVSLDDEDSRSNKIMYVPMATTTIRTTLPSKTMSFAHDRNSEERNTNILFANLVITSPSVDLTPQHLIQLLALTQSRKQSNPEATRSRHRLISRLLPKASIKFSVHEPVVRFVLPVADPTHDAPGEYDMIISAISSISLDVESSHSTGGEHLYSLASNFRVMSHQLYYQANTGVKHNLIVTEALEVKIQVTASTEVLVVVSGNLRTFSILMVRKEVSKGIYNIFRHFRKHVQNKKIDTPPTIKKNAFLRRLPSWLLEFHLEGTNCSIETAGVDSSISEQTRGVAIELESWTVDYQSQRSEVHKRPSSRRKLSHSVRTDESFAGVKHLSPPSSPARHRSSDPTDSRRMTIHGKGLEGFIIESLESWEAQPFMSLPRFEVALSTSRDMQGPIFHVNTHFRAFYLHFSLYRMYSIEVAGSIIKDAFLGPPTSSVQTESHPSHHVQHDSDAHYRTNSSVGTELLTVDIKSSYIQVKANMPADPPMLLQLYNINVGRHRWSTPFLRADLLRLHAEAPHLKHIWARIVNINDIRLDLRQVKKKGQHGFVDEKSIEVSTDFIRLGVPHGLYMYRIFDNFINTVKAMAQLKHRFKTRTNEYILQKQPEGPKKVPRVSLRCKALMFELEDDPFEWKLGTIYHVGRAQQKQRLARADAFKLKLRKLNEEKFQQSNSRHRTQSNRARSPNRNVEAQPRRSRSQDSFIRPRSTSRGRRSARDPGKIRYDREGACALSGSAKVQVEEARQKLEEHNSRSWKRRIDHVLRMQSTTIKNIRRIFSGADEPPHDSDDHEQILGIPYRPGLLTVVISDVHLVVDKPSFALTDLPNFMHDVGKGMPYDMKYALLIPMSLALDMGEARVMLRDYPINLLHIPAVRPGQPAKLPSWALRTDFVIAEEFRDDESIRHIKVDIVPKGQHYRDGAEIPGFSIDVRRTVSPVKTYSKPVIDINTSLPTTISWGTSYQPVIQDMMMIIEGFTKPEIDPSDRVGFWDKIRLSFHSRVVVNWKGDGDVQLRLKGSRDPYVVTGYGAGFVMCWRNDVQWSVHSGDDPKKFMTVRSGEYVLAIPDYSHHARHSLENRPDHDTDSVSTSSSLKNAAVFKKVIMKISGNVQWTAGLVFERDLEGGGRSSDFEPHYNVILRNPKQMHNLDPKHYDAFRGFRSHHIHLSVAVAAPYDRDWISSETNPSESYNSVHLSPRFFSHFYDWWSLFSGIMSLPIRQGPLWRGPEKTSKKFGRHLATIKYGLLLSPLFIAHIYKHKDAEDYQEDFVSATGLKLRLDSFMLDVHQRREYFDTLSRRKSEQTRTSAMKINRAELDFVRADLRAVAASIAGTTAEELQRATQEMLSSYQDVAPNMDMSKFTIPDHDFSWIDMDDFVELDWILPAESNPETKILPLAFTPRFTYFRQTEHDNAISGDESRTSPFGDEETHFCVMSHHNDPRQVQMNLINSRIDDIREKVKSHDKLMGEHQLKVIRDGDHDDSIKEKHESLIHQQQELQNKLKFLLHGLQRLEGHAHPGEAPYPNQNSTPNTSTATLEGDDKVHPVPNPVDLDGLFSAPHDEFASDFNNRFIIHNVQLKWNNSLRNIILRYSHQVSQRRGFVYYMSRRAVKFILDIVDEQAKAKQHRQQQDHPLSRMPSVLSPSEEKDEENVVEDRIKQLLSDAHRFVHVNDSESQEQKDDERPSTAELGDDVAESFQPMNSYHIRLIAPQIQLQSEKNTKAVVLVSAKGMQLKVVAIMDKERMSDEVSGLVQRRFALDMDGAQFFVTNQKRLAKFLHLYSGNRYGNPPGSSWPPWVSLEAMFDFHLNPFGFQRVIQKTSASLRYEKYNPLRLKYNEEVANADTNGSKRATRAENRIDHLWVDFPRIRVSCDSAQYYAIYIIVLDLLMYSEPLEKTRSERLEKIMLASDFSDLRGAPEMAEKLQERIRQLEEIKMHFSINAKYLDREGWQDRINAEKDLANCEDELFFIMKAINTSQQKLDDRKSMQASGLLRWYLSASEVVWHLMRDKDEPLLEFQLGNAAYERIDNSDGSNHNALEIQHIRGWNLLSNALYPEIIGPYHDPMNKHSNNGEAPQMLQLHWFMLEAIAGIPVLEQFQVTVHPLKIQLERELSKRLFEYIFPGIGSKAFEGGNFSPFMVKNMDPLGDDEDDKEAEQARLALTAEHDLRVSTNEMRRTSSPGAMGRRLKPTYNLNYHDKSNSSNGSHKNHKNLVVNPEHHKRLFRHRNASEPRNVAAPPHTPVKKSSSSSLNAARKTSESATSLPALSGAEEKRRPHVLRSSSKEHKANGKDPKDKKNADDLSQMISRASNYMTLAHVKLNSFVICLSYKGKGDRNIEDLHDFVFRLPTLEYRNKTWSNLDLAMRLKKDVVRALISHTGAIIGNKFAHHRPSKKQQDRLRELANSSTLIPNSDNLMNTPGTSETTSLYSFNQNDDEHDSPRMSFQSSQPSPIGNGNHPPLHPSLLRSGSWSSQLNNSSDNAPRSLPSDPLSRIRPSTAVPVGRSLLKDTLGRHFSGDTVKQKVQFGLRGSDSNGVGGGDESDPEVTKKKSVLLLGKKVLNKLS